MSAAPRAELPSLPSFGRYQPIFRIAAGGMAEVYGATARGEAGFRKWVALKRMLPHLSDEERFVEMFLDEAKIAANIHSPNVVSTLDLGRASDGSVFLVMDLVVGTTLSTLLKGASRAGQWLPVAVATEIVAQAAAGLHDAHEARTPDGAPLEIVHRDVSPQNVLVGIDGRTRIMDFGVARATMRETRTRTGEIKGKLSYFSPEQASLAPLDRRSDVFSLGIVAWEALAGRRLFAAENPLAILSSLTTMEIPDLHAVFPDRVPRELADVVARALLRDRDERTPSAARFAQELREAAVRASLQAPPERIAEVVRTFGGAVVGQLESAIRTLPSEVSTIAQEEPVDLATHVERRASVAPPAPRAPVRWGWGVALVAALLAAVGLGWGLSHATAPVAAPAPAVEVTPIAETAIAPNVEPPGVDEPAPPSATETAETPVGADVLDGEPEVTAEPPEPRRGGRRRPVTATTSGASEPPAHDTDEAPPDPPPDRRAGGLRDLDSFERSLGGP